MSGKRKLAGMKTLLEDLVGTYPPEESAESAVRALYAAGRNRDKEVRNYLGAKLRSRDWKIRAAAAYMLSKFPDPGSIPALGRAARDANEEVRVCAVSTLGVIALGGKAAAKKVVSLCVVALEDPSHGVRGAAFEALSHLRDPRCAALLARAADDPHPQVRSGADWWRKEQSSLAG